MGNIWLAFITGLTSGGVSCLAIQGGLLASSVTDTDNKKANASEVASFLLGKVIIYTILGLILGAVGALFILSPKTQAVIQLFIGVFLLGTAGRMLNLHPVFRYFAIQPPKSWFRLAKHNATPFLAGLATVLLPCGVTQAMMLVAVASGSAVSGALIMLAFVLGTSPVFFAIGLSAMELLKKKTFAVVAGILVAIFGLTSLNGAMALLGSNHTLQNYWKAITNNGNTNTKTAINKNGVQSATINIGNRGYTSDVTTLKVGVPVILTLKTNNTSGCARAFTLPAFGITKVLPPTGQETVEFTPTKVGHLNYSCSMGMYVGSFDVVE